MASLPTTDWKQRNGRPPMPAHRRWDSLNLALCVLLLGLGTSLAGLCSWDFFGPLKHQGQLVGASNAALGLIGLVSCAGLPSFVRPSGAPQRGACMPGLLSGPGRASVRTGLLVGLAWGAMSTTGLLSQMATDVGVHCSLAESFVRLSHLETRLTAMKHDEMITQVFFRLNELDDMLDLVHEGAVGVGEARNIMHHAKLQDRDFINHRISRLQKHAEGVASALRSRALEVKANISHWRRASSMPASSMHAADGGVGGWAHEPTATMGVSGSGLPLEPKGDDEARKTAEEALWMLEKRIEAVDSVIQYLDTKHAHGEMTYEEYEIILGALVDGGNAGVGGWAAGADVINVESLKRDQSELAKLKDAFNRLSAQQYAHEAGTHLEAVKGIQQKRDNARRDFENRFMGVLDSHTPVHPSTFHDSLVKALDDLPGHCLSEMHGYRIGWWIMMVLLAVQAAAAHAALTAIVHAAAAKDD